MQRYTVQIDPPIHPAFWPAAYPGDVPRWHFSVEAASPAMAIAIMRRGYCKDMPMRVVPPLG
jgi:hypothetical protein